MKGFAILLLSFTCVFEPASPGCYINAHWVHVWGTDTCVANYDYLCLIGTPSKCPCVNYCYHYYCPNGCNPNVMGYTDKSVTHKDRAAKLCAGDTDADETKVCIRSACTNSLIDCTSPTCPVVPSTSTAKLCPP